MIRCQFSLSEYKPTGEINTDCSAPGYWPDDEITAVSWRLSRWSSSAFSALVARYVRYAGVAKNHSESRTPRY
ncbi:hypothetical protein KCP69_05660 [Salmonella enterica subsp. enterica]|nr:hypothetical protein KCP69_05660 [Salmonella enterica subsp. enterica]